MTDYQQTLDAARAQAGVTGASFAYWDGEALHTAVSGLRNSVTGDPVTTDTVMHIGSITKIFNAALVMQLVDDGLIGLDDPVIEHLPDFKLADMEAARAITCAMLLNHTSGIACMVPPDHGPDKERIEDAIRRFAELGQIHAPGEAASYNNAATVIAGYLVQVLRGESWHTLVRTRIFEPLGMRHALADLTDLPRFRCSVGDITSLQTGQLVQTTRPFLALSFAPAGATLMMSAADLVTFGRAMVTGEGPNGARILSEASARRMVEPTAAFVFPETRIGIGWMLMPGGIVTHGGGGPGVMSQLYVHPDSGRALALLTNCDKYDALKPALTQPILDAWAPDAIAAPTPAPAHEAPSAIDPALYEGVYELTPMRVEILSDQGGLAVRIGMSFKAYDSTPDAGQAAAVPLTPLGDHRFKAASPPFPGIETIQFIPGPDGRMKFCAAMPYNLLARIP